MFDREARLYRFAQHYLHGLADDLPDQQFGEQVNGTGHTPLWIVGHLAVVNGFALRLLGESLEVPPHWVEHFGPGSKVGGLLVDPRPSKAELLADFDASADRIVALQGTADPETMAKVHHLDFLRPFMTTNAELFAHILTTHISAHVGQLSAWRRQMGWPALF